jgi:hypothetical protein
MPVCAGKGHRHVVSARKCNFSAFNGYRQTPSRFSEVLCIDEALRWRSAAAMVDLLPDATRDDLAAYDRNLSR